MKFRSIIMTVVMLGTIMLSGCGVEIVDQGNSGVKKYLGKVEQEALPAGMHMYNPFTTSVIEMSNKVQKFEAKEPAYTKDVQQAVVTYAVNFALLPSHTVQMYSTVGESWHNIVLPQVISGSLKNIVGKWDAVELVSNRDRAAAAISQELSVGLQKYGVSIINFQLMNIDFNDSFESAVEAKVVAVQKAEESKNQTVRVTEEAKQRVIAAEADAKAMQIKSEALSKNQNLVAYEAVQKWNGVMPKIMGSQGSILNIPADLVK